jgi:hypothetical protein
VIEGEDVPVVEPEVATEVDIQDTDCPPGYILENGECVPEVVNPCPDGLKLEGNECVPDTPACPPGYHPFFGQCVKDEEEEKGGGGGCSCSTLESKQTIQPAWFLMLLVGLGFYLRLRRRTVRP